jgi:ribosomal protein S18
MMHQTGMQEEIPLAARGGNMTHEELHEMLRKRMELMEESKPKQIEFIEFESFKELIPFLESLFKLKPSLITSFSQDKFRIVIENYTGNFRST